MSFLRTHGLKLIVVLLLIMNIALSVLYFKQENDQETKCDGVVLNDLEKRNLKRYFELTNTLIEFVNSFRKYLGPVDGRNILRLSKNDFFQEYIEDADMKVWNTINGYEYLNYLYSGTPPTESEVKQIINKKITPGGFVFLNNLALSSDVIDKIVE